MLAGNENEEKRTKTMAANKYKQSNGIKYVKKSFPLSIYFVLLGLLCALRVYFVSPYSIHHEFLKRILCPINISWSLLILFFSTFLKHSLDLEQKIYHFFRSVCSICLCNFQLLLISFKANWTSQKIAYRKRWAWGKNCLPIANGQKQAVAPTAAAKQKCSIRAAQIAETEWTE